MINPIYENDKLDFGDVCNIIMPMLNYYGISCDSKASELRKTLGLTRLNYLLEKKFKDEYIKAESWMIDGYLEDAINEYYVEGKIEGEYDQEKNRYFTKFKLSRSACSKEIIEYKLMYGEKPVREIRKHIRGLVRKKEIKLDSNSKTLAEYL